MRYHTQEPRLPEKPGTLHAKPLIYHTSKSQKYQSLFNLVKSIKGKQAIICTALTGKQATSLINALGNELNKPLLIKFAGMEVIR